MDIRSPVLNDEFTCHSKGNSRNYVSADRANESYTKFCEEVEESHPSNTVNWGGTPEEHEYSITLTNCRGSLDRDECEDLFDKLIHSCDSSDNPMNWKQGGKYIRQDGDYTYELNPRRSGRPWPLQGLAQKTLLPNMNHCYDLGTTNWNFNYHDNPLEHGGYEWKATFRTPKNNKIVEAAGGWTDGCGGND
ncbi:hypothetical protein SODALDRAFT_382466 [Sodiomyces alkalinus F11]|uniref:Uncharacterized protein n=1 Tax=Sodiomyces alkalinus (strain CBS 110278 / VKM F-3762 / F11) TaxID=1314773 RepID=A0A3N2PJI3_SODAK|nr:hypothetical protein SODALDRAFT_382466 [Sodiomyces alkalinus F11]ROT34544.1 hypothetical protein SODALDRAFT_382466 [Sodiomyces alkalinus F11]